MHHRRHWLSPASVSLVALAALGLAAPSRAAPRDELLRLVPDDVAFCLVVQDLRGHARALEASPFARSFVTSPLGTALLGSAEVKKLVEVDAFLKQHLGVGWAELRDDVVGEAVVLAFRAAAPGETDGDQGLFLARARGAQALADLVERLNRVQKEAGDLSAVEARTHQGATYYRRAERRGSTFYYLNGPILAFSSGEALVKQAIEGDRGRRDGEPAVARELRLLGAERALAALWVNPRAFDAAMTANAARARPEEAAAQRALLGAWKALDGAALTLSLEKDLRLGLAVRARAELLPPAWRRLLDGTATASELWGRFPEDALLTVAGRLDATALLEALDELLAPASRRALHEALERSFGDPAGMEFVTGLLPALGPDIGVCVTAPPAAEPSFWPRAVAALKVRRGTGPASAETAALNALTFYAQLAVISHNKSQKETISLRTEAAQGVEVRCLTGGAFPPGVRPAFALHDGLLIVGSTPEAVRELALAPRRAVPGGGEAPLLRLSLGRLRRYLESRRDALVAAVAQREGAGKDEAARRLAGLLAVLEHGEQLVLTRGRTGPAGTLTLRLETTRPLTASSGR
jgi:hypothetical protein